MNEMSITLVPLLERNTDDLIQNELTLWGQKSPIYTFYNVYLYILMINLVSIHSNSSDSL